LFCSGLDLTYVGWGVGGGWGAGCDTRRKEIVGETVVKERNREGNTCQTMGGGQGRAGVEAWKPRRRGGRGVGSCHPMVQEIQWSEEEP
jgi:hypothetical protein